MLNVPSGLSVVIPTYHREKVLLDTIKHLLKLECPPVEILVVDQTEQHEEKTFKALSMLNEEGSIRWIRLGEPSIPHAMNIGLLAASQDIVLFLDDDIIPEPGLIQAHLDAHHATGAEVIAGRVIQPWQKGKDYSAVEPFSFASVQPKWVDEFMGGNFSVQRNIALEVGGFDENFVGAAYRFEAEFAYRIRRAGHRIYFEPDSCIHHLREKSGGTRSYGEYLTSFKPDHPVGAYYYFLRTWSGVDSLISLITRPLRAVISRHHLRRPWWIPATLIAELSGMIWAIILYFNGPRYIERRKSPKQ
jgi:GT2 family glycosyltransferase